MEYMTSLYSSNTTILLSHEGHNNTKIAREMCIEISTLDRHIGNIISKAKGCMPEEAHVRVWLALNADKLTCMSSGVIVK